MAFYAIFINKFSCKYVLIEPNRAQSYVSSQKVESEPFESLKNGSSLRVFESEPRLVTSLVPHLRLCQASRFHGMGLQHGLSEAISTLQHNIVQVSDPNARISQDLHNVETSSIFMLRVLDLILDLLGIWQCKRETKSKDYSNGSNRPEGHLKSPCLI